jgi:hypothetical protein
MTWTATIDSREYWNPTGIILEQGKRYAFEAQGEWHDAAVRCDADGWTPRWNRVLMMLTDFAKRESGQPLFKLMGAVEKKRPYIVLGTKGSFVAPVTGELFCFANDVPGYYANNSGSVKLQIQLD